MVDLKAYSPCDGVLPVRIGQVAIAEVALAPESVWEHPEGDLWIGYQRRLQIGARPDGGVDQSDAWSVLAVSGAARLDVMARLCPHDLRSVDAMVATLLGHIPVLIQPQSGALHLWVPRSAVRGAIEALCMAARGVAARTDAVLPQGQI